MDWRNRHIFVDLPLNTMHGSHHVDQLSHVSRWTRGPSTGARCSSKNRAVPACLLLTSQHSSLRYLLRVNCILLEQFLRSVSCLIILAESSVIGVSTLNEHVSVLDARTLWDRETQRAICLLLCTGWVQNQATRVRRAVQAYTRQRH